MEKQPAVYILASQRNGTLYTGVTSDLIARAWQHRDITREKRIKKWNRAWKIELIEGMNPYWNDLWVKSPDKARSLGSRLRGNDGIRAIRQDGMKAIR